ncbi:hypothetical protein [Streptomyces xantholiticus]|uniref:Gram-positive cocci surface proteins LPxTG domain-containing protein n=1 Tax=Streptomyces xantholiticus TaxID=68285 RepID=A0ABV1V2C6_9ACTN
MRTRNALALTTAASLIAPALMSGSAAMAAAVTSGVPLRAAISTQAAPLAAHRSGSRPAEPAPTCGKSTDPDFPIKTRIHGGPATVRAGSGFHSWSVELANSTRESCDRIHPVLVLTARDRSLTADRVTLEFHDQEADRWRPVTLERTMQDEFVGVFDDGFQGFVVPGGKTVTVRTRLSVAVGTAANEVTVNAAVVQRKGDDGDWVGESGDYRFAVLEGDRDGGESLEPTPARSAGVPPTAPTPTTGPAEESPPSTHDQLATTGSDSLARVGIGVAVILLSSGLLVFVARRLRSQAGHR